MLMCALAICRTPSASRGQFVTDKLRRARISEIPVEVLDQSRIQITHVYVASAERRFDTGLPSGAEINARSALRIIKRVVLVIRIARTVGIAVVILAARSNDLIGDVAWRAGRVGVLLRLACIPLGFRRVMIGCGAITDDIGAA
jgi:hypothetical protein